MLRRCLFSLLGLALAHGLYAQSGQVMTLERALREGRIEARIQALGGHHGETIQLELRNRGDERLRISMQPGQILEPADSLTQPLIVGREQWAAVGAKQTRAIPLFTYCGKMQAASPLAGAVFSLGAMAPAPVVQLLEFLIREDKTALDDAQQAVWALTGGASLASIGDEAIADYCAQLLNQSRPPYKVRYASRPIAPGERMAPRQALEVEASFSYVLTREETVIVTLRNAEGVLIRSLSRAERQQAGEHRSGLKLKVFNLPPGRYLVRIETLNRQTLKEIAVEF